MLLLSCHSPVTHLFTHLCSALLWLLLPPQAHEKSSFQVEPMFQVNTASGVTLPSSAVAHAHFGLKALSLLRRGAELCVSTADNALIHFSM